jgi:hypothetical protein
VSGKPSPSNQLLGSERSTSDRHAVRPGSVDRPVLIISDDVLGATWRAFRLTADRGWEGTVRWAAPRAMALSALQVVTTVIVPSQRVSPGGFEIPHEAVRQMGARLREEGLVNIAQLHTHPSGWVGHSAWDDQRAYSRRDGALSIVWPEYGRALYPPERWGVHECRAGEWVRLGSEELQARIIVVPGLLDLRAAFFGVGGRKDRERT